MNEECVGQQPVATMHQYPADVVGIGYGVGAHEQAEPACSQGSAISFASGPFDLSANNWACHNFAATNYQDMRNIQANSYSSELSALNYPDLNSIKYNYDDTNSIYQKEQMSSSSASTIDVDSLTTHSGSIHDEKQGASASDACSSTASSVDSNSNISSDTILMPMVKRGRPTENPCWSYFIRIDDQLVKCRICTKLVKSACATNMTKHLERHHANDYEKLAEQIRLYRLNDASFRTKVHYLTHMSPPEQHQAQHQAHQQEQPQAQCSSIIQDHFEPSLAYYEPAVPIVVGPVYQSQATAFNEIHDGMNNWNFSHFWPPLNIPPLQQQHHHHQNPHQGSSSSSTSSSTSSMLPLPMLPSGVELSHELNLPSTSAAIPPIDTANNRKNCPNAKKPCPNGVQWSGSAPASTVTPIATPIATATASERPYMKRNRKTEHPVWEYFKRTGDGNAECSICAGVVKSPCSSNFMRHLMRHHGSEYNNVYLKWIQKRDEIPVASQNQNQNQINPPRSRLRIPPIVGSKAEYL